MPTQSQFAQREITLEVEEQMGVSQADSPSSVLLVKNFSAQYYIGDDETLDFDSLDALPATEVKKLSPQSTFAWETPLTKPDDGVYPSWANLFRTCGFNMLDTKLANPSNPQLVFTHSLPNEIDTATIREYQAADALRNHKYVGEGATGNISLEFVAGKIPMLKVSNYLSNYVRPSLVAPFVADKSLVNVEECKAAAMDGHVVSQLDGKDVCIQSLMASNIDGRDIGIDDFFCRKIAGGGRKQVQIEIIYLNPDWDTEFNPWELGESHETTQRVPFIFEHELGKLFIEECQPMPPEKIEYGKAKLKCMKQTLNVLAGFELSFSY